MRERAVLPQQMRKVRESYDSYRISATDREGATSIPELWEMLNLPGKPERSCRSPFREDRSPSFSIYDDGRRWKDHATGEGGDAVDFLARALNLSNEDACKKLIELAGVSPKISHLPRREERQADGAKESVQLELPPLTPYSWDLAQRVAKSRGDHCGRVRRIMAQDFGLWVRLRAGMLDSHRQLQPKRRSPAQ